MMVVYRWDNCGSVSYTHLGIESMTPLLKEEKSEDKHTIDITAESTVA